MASKRLWSYDELIIAMNLYCKLPFGQFHKSTPMIIEVAQKLGRTPSSLAMKLCNFASIDPVQNARGITVVISQFGKKDGSGSILLPTL